MRLIIVSNRSPITISKDENGNILYEESVGGLATGLRTYIEKSKKRNPEREIIWIGYAGSNIENEKEISEEVFKKFQTKSVFLSKELQENFYDGFCNKTLWPLFHYFPETARFKNNLWESYVEANNIFSEAVIDIYKPGDFIWVHDYHLMLLPSLLRNKIPDSTIGFFLHIPFPSYEIFRMLPSVWRKKIIEGLYGSDLIGFHTHDYCTYFLQSTLRILGISHNMNEV